VARAFLDGVSGKGLVAWLRDGLRRCVILGQGFPALQLLPNRSCGLSGLRRRRLTATKAVARRACPQIRASRKAKREKQHCHDATSLVFHRVPLLNARPSQIQRRRTASSWHRMHRPPTISIQILLPEVIERKAKAFNALSLRRVFLTRKAARNQQAANATHKAVLSSPGSIPTTTPLQILTRNGA
jgi:hypothetical protein